jgi:UDP-3-O-[3-hydroxymyristoyl] glucosamine N-acyltransferase
LQIGDRARIAAKAGLMRDVAAGETVIGSPAVPAATFWRQVAFLQRAVRKRAGDD